MADYRGLPDPICHGDFKSTGNGGLTKEQVANRIHEALGDVHVCHEWAIHDLGTVNGNIVVEFLVDREGRVPDACVKEDTIRDRGLSNCLIAKLKELSFPKPQGDATVVVSYPFLFKTLER